MIAIIRTLLAILPELIQLIKIAQEGEQKKKYQAYVNAKLKKDMQKINEAFRTRDARMLNELFGSLPDKDKTETET